MKLDCCSGENGCLEGEEWMDCMSNCRSYNEISPEGIALYEAINECVACDACAISCGENMSEDWLTCQVATEINVPTNPCYEDEVEEGEIACFAWAGWGGPCTDAAAQCMNDPACVELDNCINDSWDESYSFDLQEQCFANYTDVEEIYWAFQQCIYCDACDLACAGDAASKHCDEYFEK
ncbi:MAG: hypothetical protein JXX29_09045 [Deltaproteobacteria bacterium]|nr:hypothetical protein [Deltaproteobacteria bacterium]MBN2671808.1 hypothetical protein [Deltaproteobacteria bacterium]